ncbi:YbdD/YjiX family protein [Brevundimonas sp. 2YAF1]
MIGQPDYDAYVAHAKATHPDQPPLDRTAFFRLHEQRRFGGSGGFRCC